jgi:hypothetical protein
MAAANPEAVASARSRLTFLIHCIADEADRHHPLQRWIPLVGQAPLICELLDASYGIMAFDKLDPVRAGRKLIRERIERRDPRNRRFRVPGRMHDCGWDARRVLLANSKLKWGLLGCMSCGGRLPARWCLWVEGFNHVEGQAWSSIQSQNSTFKEDLVEQDTGVLEPTAERCYWGTGNESAPVRTERDKEGGLVFRHGPSA